MTSAIVTRPSPIVRQMQRLASKIARRTLRRLPWTKRKELRKMHTGRSGMKRRRTASAADADVTPKSQKSSSRKAVVCPTGSTWREAGLLQDLQHDRGCNIGCSIRMRGARRFCSDHALGRSYLIGLNGWYTYGYRTWIPSCSHTFGCIVPPLTSGVINSFFDS